MGNVEGRNMTFKGGIVQIGRLCFVVDKVQRPSRAKMYRARDQTSDMVMTEDWRCGQFRTLHILPHQYPTFGPDGGRRNRCVIQRRRSADYPATILLRGLKAHVSSSEMGHNENNTGGPPATKARPNNGYREH